jgi:hypothetical protein
MSSIRRFLITVRSSFTRLSRERSLRTRLTSSDSDVGPNRVGSMSSQSAMGSGSGMPVAYASPGYAGRGGNPGPPGSPTAQWRAQWRAGPYPRRNTPVTRTDIQRTAPGPGSWSPADSCSCGVDHDRRYRVLRSRRGVTTGEGRRGSAGEIDEGEGTKEKARQTVLPSSGNR